MPEEPKNIVNFINNYNSTPSATTPKSTEPLSTVDFINNYNKKPVSKQDINLAMQDAPILLDNNEELTLDPNQYETKYQSEFKDKVNSFWQGIDETQKSANDYHITKAQLKIATNNKLLKQLDPKDPQALELLRDNQNQFKEIESATEDKVANQKEIDDEYVSKKYKLNEALVQGQGSEAGFFDKMAYTMPNMIGSSVSLVIPNLIATFGTKAGATLATSALAKAGLKGRKAGWIGAATALTGALGGIALGRNLETQSEVGGQITSNIDKLTQDYIDNTYYQTGEQLTKDQIPQDVMDDIIIQANKGREDMYWENMALAVPDMAEALLFSPKLNLFGVNKLSKLADKAINYNKYTRLGTKAAKFGTVYESEKFEEGSQYAYGKRQEDFALNSGEYENKGFIKNLLTDSGDVLSSMNFSPIGEVRGSGRYADDKQFQTAEESGGMLAAIMGGVSTVASVTKDLNTYRKVNKELQDDGVFNVDATYFRLKDQILQKHFENGTTHHLLEGVKNLIGKKNEDGTEILTKEQAKEEVDKVQKSFDVYNEVNSQVNEIEKKGAFLMFDSAEQKVAKKAVKDNLFHTSLQLAREQKDLTDLTTKRSNIQNAINDPKLKDYNNISDLVEKQKDVITKLEAFNPMKVIPEAFNIPFRIKAQKDKLKELEAIKKAEEERLTEAGIDFKVEPLTIAEQDLNKQIIAKESLLEEQKDKYKELLKIKDDKSLQDWYSKYTKNKIEAKETADVADAKQKNTEETTEKPVTDFSGFEDSENPTDGENVTTSTEGETWYDNITNQDEFFERINEGVITEQFTPEEATEMVNDWKAKQAAKTAAPKTDWNKIIASAVSTNELDRIIDQIDVEGSMSESLLTSINKKRESLTKKDLTENEVTEKLSNGVTNAFDDNLNTDEVLESNNTSNETSNKEFVSKKPNALMMKFYEFLDKTKKWARHTSGELRGYVIGESQPGVSMEVNNPNVATEGSEVTYVHNGTDISLVDADGRVVGFMGLGTNKPGPTATLDVIEAHKNLLAIRAYVLSQPSGTVKTTVLVKGHGKLLTKMEGNLPILDQEISQRPEDMIEGRPLFLWDNGSRLVNNNLTEEQAKVAKLFENISFTNSEGIGEGRVYQAVKTANGTWFVIPVYTKVIGQTVEAEKTINTIISILKGAIADGKTINYQKALQQLNKYIFATNTANYKSNVNTLRIYEDKEHVENGTISVGGFKLTFGDVLTGNKLVEFKAALGSVRHNISINELGTLEEDSRLTEGGILTTNAYTDPNGQYYVQPYIEVNDPQGYVKPEVKVEPIKATTTTNIAPVVDPKADREKRRQANDTLGKSILQKLGYKNENRLPNGNVKGGQSGWKIRFNIKNPKTGDSYYADGKSTLVDAEYNKRAETLINFLLDYFGSNQKADSKNLQKHYVLEDKDGLKREPFKHLSGGEIGESDFTIYIGSANDVMKFISDIRIKHPEILELLHAGNKSEDVAIDDIFKGRIEGSKIGFSGYHAPTNLNKVTGSNDFTFNFNQDRVNINYNGTSLSDITIIVESSDKGYKGVFDENLKKDFPELYKNIRNIVGFQLYGDYLQGSNDEFLKLTGVDKINAKYDAELAALENTTATTKQEIVPPNQPRHDISNIKINDSDDWAESRTKLEGGEINQASLKALNKILPGLTVANAKLAEEVGKNMKDTYGMFHNMLIYLFKGATNQTLFHEAFHGVFRNILSDTERKAVLDEAIKKYDKPDAARLQFLRDGKGNANLSDEILTQLHYEERLADDFGKHADGVFNPSLGQRILNFFNKIVDLFNVFRNANTDQINNLFEAVTKGKFATRSIVAKLANKAIDLNDFGGAYKRVLNTSDLEIPLSVELERTNSIANQVLDGIAKELAKGVPMSKISISEITFKIREQYKLVFAIENAKSKDEFNPQLYKISYAVDLKFGEIFENVKKQIALTRKLHIKGDFIDTTEIEGAEDTATESENIDNMQGNESKGFQEQTVISGIRSATQDIKLFLSNIPVIDKDGVVQMDNFGFTLFHSYEKLYYKLESSLVGTTSFVEQMKIMKELAPFSNEIKQIIDAVEAITDPQVAKNFKQQFAANFNKQVLNYKLITYSKKGTKYIFKMLNPNRKDVALNLKTQWTSTNITDATNLATNDIRTFNEKEAIYEVSKNKVQALLDSYWAKGENTKGGKILTPVLTLDEVYELAQKLGIGISFDSIELYSSLEEANLVNLTKDLLDYGKYMYVENKFSPARNTLTKLINLETNAQTELFTSSFNNVENSVVYAVQHQSFASKLVKALNSKEASSSALVKELERDPMNFGNIILANKNKLEMFALDGLKMQGDNITGKKFNQIHEDDYLAMVINMYDNPSAKGGNTTEETAVYAPIIPAEKGLSFGFTGVKIEVNKRDGKIPADSQIVKEFTQLFFNELSRIRQVMVDIKTLPENKLISNVHLGKKLGLKFNLPNAISPELKTKLDAFLEKTLNETIPTGVNPSEYVRGLLENTADKKTVELMSKVTESIISNLENIAQDHIELALNSDVIQEKDGVLTSDKIETTNVEKLITEWALNSTLFNVSQSMLINGDPAFYKGAEDNGKRFYQGFSMLKFADTSTIDKSYKYLKGGKMKINVIADVEEGTRSTQDLADIAKENNLPNVQKLANDHYNTKVDKDGKVKNPLNATDAQLFVSVGIYEELKRVFGISSEELSEGFSNADLANAMNSVPKSQQGILDIIKPFFYGVQWNEEYQRYIPIQVKCSIFPLTNKYVANNPLLAEHKALMDADENYPQVMAFHSSMKAFLPSKADILTPNKTSIVELDLNNFGEQVANPDHMLDSHNSSLRQMKMLMYGMVAEVDAQGNDLMYGDKTGRQIKDEIAMLDKANIEEALGKVVEAFEGNNKEFNEFIQNAITSRNSTSIIEAVFEQKPDGSFSYPLDLINSKATIQLISSIFSKRVVRQEFKGGAAVQVSSVGLQIAPKESDYKNAKAFQEAVDASPELTKLQTSLSWIRKGDVDANGKVSSIDYIEAYAPAHAKEFINKDGSFKDNIPEELRQMLIYRIPYEGAHSSMVIKIVGFLPQEYKGAMLLPYEVTQQFGADFDFDKIYFIAKDFTMSKDGKFKIFKYIDGTDNASVAARYQELIKYILKNDKNARDLIKVTEKEEDFTLNDEDKLDLLLKANIIPSLDTFRDLSVADQNIKPARDNKILDNYMQILRSVNMLESLITPSGPGAIADVYENVEEDEDHGNYFTPGHQVYLKALFHKISMLKGVSALQVTGHAWATEGNLVIKPVTVKIDGVVTVVERGVKVFKKNAEGKNETELKNNLSKIMSDTGSKIVEEISSLMAVILDAVKTPNQLPSIGISIKTLPMWSYLVRLGFGSKVASQFTSQQAIKDLSAALENNDKQLKSKDFIKQDVNTVKAEYVQKYQAAHEALYAEHKPKEGTSYDSRKIVEFLEKNDPEKIAYYNTLSLENLEKYSTLSPEELAKKKAKQPYTSISKTNANRTGIDKLKYLQSQIVALNVFKESEDVIKELGRLNQLFSVNKETGPNFEDVNSKKASYDSLVKDDTLISGIDRLLNSDVIKPYIDTINAQFEIMAKHYNFASPFFNNIKDYLAKLQYGDNADLTRIPAEDREVANGFIQMFLDAEETFSDIYEDENRISEEDFLNDLRVLLAKKISTTYKYKIFGNKELSAKAQEQLKATTLLKSLEVVSIKNSNQSYVALKGNRYELAQKEMMIDEIVRLYNSKYKTFATRLIKQAFQDNGFFSGLHSYSGLIHPSVLQDMGLVEGRAKIRKMVKAESTNKGRMDRIIDQFIRNNAKKFTRVYDNNQKLFTEVEGGKTIVVDMNSKDSRLKSELVRSSETNKHPMYIRYTLNDLFTPIYKLDEEATEESGQITYRQVSYLGSPAKKIEINPFSDEVETKFPNNKYEKFVVKDKTGLFGGKSEKELAAEFGEDETTPVPEAPEVETESNTENIIEGQAEIEVEKSEDELLNEWGDDSVDEESTETEAPAITREYTSENITSLNINELFVFGSNNRGVHGKGAALVAKTKFGAIYGQPFGKQGQSFAVRTKMYQDGKLTEYTNLTEDNKKEMDKMTIQDLALLREEALKNPNNKYYVTEIGTKLAGRTVEQMKDFFNRMNTKLGIPNNIILPKVFEVRDENISLSQEKSVSSTIINPEITQNKPEGLPGIDRSPESCS